MIFVDILDARNWRFQIFNLIFGMAVMLLYLYDREMVPTGQRPLLKDILGARMLIMWEEQLVDPPIAYIFSFYQHSLLLLKPSCTPAIKFQYLYTCVITCFATASYIQQPLELFASLSTRRNQGENQNPCT